MERETIRMSHKHPSLLCFAFWAYTGSCSFAGNAALLKVKLNVPGTGELTDAFVEIRSSARHQNCIYQNGFYTCIDVPRDKYILQIIRPGSM